MSDNGKVHKKVLVCGGRDYTDVTQLDMILTQLADNYNIECIIEGDAPGADRLAGSWARTHAIPNFKYPADWDKYGKYAGPKRNKQMLQEAHPDLVVAFAGLKGTADMIKKAKTAGITVLEVPITLTGKIILPC